MKSLFSRSKPSRGDGDVPPAPSDLGLPVDGLCANGIAVGFFPEYGTYGARQINPLLPAPMSIIGDFVQISDTDMSLNQVDWHLDDVLACPNAVYAPAVMPQSGFRSFDAHKADVVARKMAEVNRKGRTVWLRFAHEMNGDWYIYGRRPKEFVAAWQLLTRAVRQHTAGLPAKTYMLWAPNVADTTGGIGGYKEYWPGADYVDICGLSLYFYSEYNTRIPSDSLSSRFAPFYKLYAAGEGKPITLAETSAPYKYYDGTNQPIPGDEDEVSMKLDWLNQVFNASHARKFPLLHSAVWFNYNKSEDGRQKDFRAFLGNPEVSSAMGAALSQMHRRQ